MPKWRINVSSWNSCYGILFLYYLLIVQANAQWNVINIKLPLMVLSNCSEITRLKSALMVLLWRDKKHSSFPQVGISESVVKRCAVQIASALEFIHRLGLVHRDIKPENILLLDTQCRHVKLADFGLTQKRGTLICYISSTLPYMAPELCAMVAEDGQEKPQAPPLSIQPSLDTWAFGVLLFCILTGFFPWEHCTSTDSFYEEFAEWRQDTETTEIPTQWKRFTPACLEMFGKLLALEPNNRSTADVVKGYVGKEWVKPKRPNESEGVSAMATLSSPCRSSPVLQ